MGKLNRPQLLLARHVAKIHLAEVWQEEGNCEVAFAERARSPLHFCEYRYSPCDLY